MRPPSKSIGQLMPQKYYRSAYRACCSSIHTSDWKRRSWWRNRYWDWCCWSSGCASSSCDTTHRHRPAKLGFRDLLRRCRSDSCRPISWPGPVANGPTATLSVGRESCPRSWSFCHRKPQPTADNCHPLVTERWLTNAGFTEGKLTNAEVSMPNSWRVSCRSCSSSPSAKTSATICYWSSTRGWFPRFRWTMPTLSRWDSSSITTRSICVRFPCMLPEIAYLNPKIGRCDRQSQ